MSDKNVFSKIFNEGFAKETIDKYVEELEKNYNYMLDELGIDEKYRQPFKVINDDEEGEEQDDE